MSYLDDIKDLEDNELEEFVYNRITLLEEEAKDNSEDDFDTIGYLLEKNKTNKIIYDVDEDLNCEIRCLYNGYIRKGLRMVYGATYNEYGKFSSAGCYYYVDCDDYLLDFCKYIKDVDLIDEYDLFTEIKVFLDYYFGKGRKTLDREDMFKLIYKDEDSFYDPIVEHGISWFKDKGNALCSEYSILAQNILTFFGINTSLVMGRVEQDDKEAESHAYNLISYHSDKYDEDVNALIDFADCTHVVDMNYNTIGTAPYIYEMEELNDELLDDLLENQKPIVCEDYIYMMMGNELIPLTFDSNRNYFINVEIPIYLGPISEKKYIKK